VILNTFSTSDSPRKVVIAIHGWTGDVSSMEPVAKSLRLPDTKWVFPQAPYKSDKSGFTGLMEMMKLVGNIKIPLKLLIL